MSKDKNNVIKIFVSAYACEPGLGSEIGVGWHWVLEMSKYFELWVLTRESNRGTIEPWIAEHPEFSGIHFLYFDLPKWARFWKKGMRGVRIYYNLWQMCTNRIVKRTMLENDIRIYHLLTYGNALWPVSSYGKRQFFIWGPTSVGTYTPTDFTKYYSFFSRQKEVMQRFMKKTLFMNLGFRNRCKHADIILCKTDETIKCIPLKYRQKCIQFTDVAVNAGNIELQFTENAKEDNTIHFFTAGTLVGWRNFDVLIEAFRIVKDTVKNTELTIVGGGKEKERLKKLSQKLGLNNCIYFTGQLKMENYLQELNKADVVVNPCFREGSVTVSFDSMSYKKPLICFDSGGYTHYFNDAYSIVLKDIKKRNVAIQKLADAMIKLSDKGVAQEMGRLSNEAGKLYSWENKGLEIYKIVHMKYQEYNNGK